MKTPFNFAIVGAGMTALTFARLVAPSDCLIIEKSRGIGGRLASRRLGDFWINHGPKGFEVTDSFLLEMVLETPGGYFTNQNLIYKAEAPLSNWAKLIAGNKEIKRECKVAGFKKTPQGHELWDEKNNHICFAEYIVLTTPAPQAKEILIRSNYNASFLDAVEYESCVQFMALSQSELPQNIENGSFYELKMKASPKAGLYLYHFEVRADYIPHFLELDKDEIKNKFLQEIKFGEYSLLDTHAHKWRYSTVKKGLDPKYQKIFQDKVWLAGDYFFGSDLNASVLSAKALVIS